MAQSEQTLVIIKPDAVQRGLAGEILARYERRGLKIVAGNFATVTDTQAQEHYGEHKGKPFFEGLVSYITSSPSFLLVLEGPGAVGIVRTVNGSTKPAEAAPGTIRADFGLTIANNLVHGSDSVESAQREIGIFFADGGIVEYERPIDKWILE
ncbi:MAG: nucleoside-diphosphate kinase [Thermomicrobiales bacterium]